MGSVKIQLSAIGDLQTNLGKADVIINAANAKLIEAKLRLTEADALCKKIQTEATRLLPMATALGEKSLEAQIKKVLTDVSEQLKFSSSKLNQLK